MWKRKNRMNKIGSMVIWYNNVTVIIIRLEFSHKCKKVFLKTMESSKTMKEVVLWIRKFRSLSNFVGGGRGEVGKGCTGYWTEKIQ